MANKYFTNFPLLYYPHGDDYKLAVDILRRANFTKLSKAKKAALLDYTVRDGDTPDNIAARFYGSPHLHWIVLMVNDIMNPYYDWPLKAEDFDEYVTRKYGEGFRNQPHHIEILNTGIQVDASDPLYTEDGYMLLIEGGLYDGQSLLVFEDSTVSDEELAIITNYQYEFALNQQKRKIKLLRH